MDEKLVKLRTYGRMEEALLDENILRQNEIDCSVYNSTCAEILPMLYEMNEGIALMVFERDFDHAWEVLKEYHQLDAD